MQWSTLSAHFAPALIQPWFLNENQKKKRLAASGFDVESFPSMDRTALGIAAKKGARIIIIAASSLGLILATIATPRLEARVPSIDRSNVWIRSVKRGQ